MAAQSNHHSFGSRQAASMPDGEQSNSTWTASPLCGPPYTAYIFLSEWQSDNGEDKKRKKKRRVTNKRSGWRSLDIISQFSILFAPRPMSHLSQVLVRRFIVGRSYIGWLVDVETKADGAFSLTGGARPWKWGILFSLSLIWNGEHLRVCFIFWPLLSSVPKFSLQKSSVVADWLISFFRCSMLDDGEREETFSI